MIAWVLANIPSLAGIVGMIPLLLVLRRAPEFYARLAVIANCEWHRAQGLAREEAMEKAIDRLERELDKAQNRTGFNDSSGSSGTTPTTQSTTPG